jgi:ribose/xylose/arabinose/galactoside ABC-type transport system permease subunit
MGGRGTVAGAVIGAVLMESLANGMSLMNLSSSYQSIAVGLVLLFAVYVDVEAAAVAATTNPPQQQGETHMTDTETSRPLAEPTRR